MKAVDLIWYDCEIVVNFFFGDKIVVIFNSLAYENKKKTVQIATTRPPVLKFHVSNVKNDLDKT